MLLVNKLYFFSNTRFCLRLFVSVAKTYAKAELVAFAKAQLLNIWLAQLVVCEETDRTAKADRSYSKRPCRKHYVLSKKSTIISRKII